MPFLRNVWYAAAWAQEIRRALNARTLLGVPVVLFRDAQQGPVILADMCPHRFAPLSRGRLVGSDVECGYHGLRFGRDGRCTLNPHAPELEAPSALRARAYPAIERHGVIWAWMGDAEQSDPDAIPDLAFMAPDPARRTTHSYHLGAFPYDLLIDNLLDLSHAEYLHQETFSRGPGDEISLQAWEEGGGVTVERTQLRAPPPPRYEHVASVVDITFRMRWSPSQVIAFDRYIRPTGQPREAGVHSRFCHLATPETERTTHYFHAVARVDDIHNEAIDEAIRSVHARAIVGEDVSMLEAVAERMGGRDLMDLSPISLGIDQAALLVRSVMGRLLSQELGLRRPAPVPSTRGAHHVNLAGKRASAGEAS
jgi:vanillate O-demethylase monooxygenase subunit